MTKSYEELLAENEELRESLDESQELLQAISMGEVDALVISRPEGEQVFTLEGSDRAYRVLIEAMNEGAVTMTSDGTILYCNRHFADMIKSPLEKVIGSTIYRFIPQADQTAFKVLQQRLGSGELTLRADDEYVLPVYISINSLQLSLSQEAFCVVVTDLTEQKRREEIVAAEKLARSIIEQATEAVVVCNEDGEIFRFSNAVYRILGCDPSLQNFEDLFGLQLPMGRKLSPVSMALRGEVLLQVEASFKRSDGILFHLLVNAGPLKGANGKIIGCVVTFSDITERKRMEETLRENEALLRSFFDSPGSMRGIVDVIDNDVLYISYNSAMAAFYSLAPEAMCGKLASQLNVPRKVLQLWLDRFEESRCTNQAVTFEMFYPRPDCTMWLSATFSYLGIGPAGYPRFAFVLQDITERKQTEQALQEKKEEIEVQAEELESINEELLVNNEALQATTKSLQESQTLLSAVTEGIPDPIFIKDRQSRLILANPAMLRVIDKPLEEAIGKDDREHYDDPAVWGAIMANDRRILESGQTGVIEEMWQTPEGYRIFLSTKTPYRNSNGEIIGILGISRDITELKRTGEALRETKDYLENLFEYANAPIIVWDPYLRITRFNHAFERLTGLKSDDVLGKPLDMLFPESSKDESLAYIRSTLSGERWEVVEIPILRTDGSIRTVLWNTANVYAEDGTTVVATIAQGQDITERKQAEMELRKSRDELEQRVRERTSELQSAKEDLEVINVELQAELKLHQKLEAEIIKAKEAAEEAVKVKASFMANMSHELRTPMNSVIGFTSLLLDEKLTPEQKDYVESIRNSGEALMALINEVLDFSRMEREMIEPELQPFDLRQCVEESLDLVATKAAEKDFELIYTFGRTVPEAIIGDPSKLRQILGNFLSNAVKFTKDGEIEVDVTLDSEQNEIHFAVRDTGVGISQEDMGKLFLPFSQLDMSYSRGYEGTGLGLAINKKLIELMGGKIWVESEVDKGSTFHFTIPAKVAPSNYKPFLAGNFKGFKGKRVLIVEGNQTLRRTLGQQVHAWGMMPMTASNIQEAMGLLQRDSDFNVVIVDASKDDGDAISIIAEKRDQWKQLPFIAFASLGQKVPPDIFRAVLTKPFKPAKLYNALYEVLTRDDSDPDETETSEADKSYVPLRILLAEDNASNQKVTLKMLNKLGYRADAVVNGQEVLEALERQPYDVIFMDVKMPVMTGIEAARKIRERWPENGPKIIAITAYALHGDREKCLDAGMDSYIPKPVQKEDLEEVLEKYKLKTL